MIAFPPRICRPEFYALVLFAYSIILFIRVSKLQVELNGAMVAAHDIVVDSTVFHELLEFLGNHKVVQSPPYAFSSATTAHRPPAVFHFGWIELAVCIHPSTLQQFCKIVSFRYREACCFKVVLWSCNIDVLVADV